MIHIHINNTICNRFYLVKNCNNCDFFTVGNSTTPIYIDSDGKAQSCDNIPDAAILYELYTSSTLSSSNEYASTIEIDTTDDDNDYLANIFIIRANINSGYAVLTMSVNGDEYGGIRVYQNGTNNIMIHCNKCVNLMSVILQCLTHGGGMTYMNCDIYVVKFNVKLN